MEIRFRYAASVPCGGGRTRQVPNTGLELPELEIFHGYVVPWKHLPQECRNALMRAGMANLRGKIL